MRARAGRSVRIYGCKAAGGMLENLLALHISWLLRRVFADVQLGLAALLAPLVGDIECRWVDQEPEEAMRLCKIKAKRGRDALITREPRLRYFPVVVRQDVVAMDRDGKPVIMHTVDEVKSL